MGKEPLHILLHNLCIECTFRT